MRRRLVFSLVGIILVAVGTLTANLIAGNRPSLGLDLQGGASVTLEPQGDYDPEALSVAVEIIRQRVDSIGVAEPEIIRQGDTVVVNLPGVKDQKRALEIVGRTGEVLMRPVLQSGVPNDNPSSTTVPGGGSTTIPGATSTTAVAATSTTGVATTVPAPGSGLRFASAATSTSLVEATTTSLIEATSTSAVESPSPTVAGAAVDVTSTTTADILLATGDTTTTTVAPATPDISLTNEPDKIAFLNGRDGFVYYAGPAGADGQVFKNDAAAEISAGGWVVNVGLKDGSEGEGRWNALANECFSKSQTCPTGQIAIVLDGEVISAPVVQTNNFSGSVQISGNFSESEARDLAKILEFGAVPVRFSAPTAQTVSATLGQDSLDAALVSGLVGVALVLLFLVFYYRRLAFVVLGGLAVSAMLQWSTISWLSARNGLALSLSGVTGIIVSIGVTVDSYVVFFEKLKDDVLAGRTLRNSATRSFQSAWRTILAADTVSLLGAVVLWFLTVGSVRGFAFFLGLSTLCDMIVAYFFTRPTVILLARSKFMNKGKMFGVSARRVLDGETSPAGGAQA
ncbi:MAG: protein translocase subunit SecD [Acidobacteria bacterium]|nr:protein translocase subunit SecD [Acidobacteriota bacterium]